MSSSGDLVSVLITSAMVALIRLIDAWVLVDAGLPLEQLKARSIEELNAEAERYVEQIKAERSKG